MKPRSQPTANCFNIQVRPSLLIVPKRPVRVPEPHGLPTARDGVPTSSSHWSQGHPAFVELVVGETSGNHPIKCSYLLTRERGVVVRFLHLLLSHRMCEH